MSKESVWKVEMDGEWQITGGSGFQRNGEKYEKRQLSFSLQAGRVDKGIESLVLGFKLTDRVDSSLSKGTLDCLYFKGLVDAL